MSRLDENAPEERVLLFRQAAGRPVIVSPIDRGITFHRHAWHPRFDVETTDGLVRDFLRSLVSKQAADEFCEEYRREHAAQDERDARRKQEP